MAQCTEDSVRKMLPMVSEQRRERALQYKFTFGQFACLKSYVMLAQIVMDEKLLPGTTTIPELIFGTGQHGKPFLVDYPDIHFSISHCKRAIAVAVDARPMGIDVECFREAKDSLIERTMNAEEICSIRHSDCPSIAFTTLWTRKEAVLKLKGTGIIYEMSDVLQGMEVVDTEINESKQYVYSVARFPL